MNDDDYHDILRFARRAMRKANLSAIDERIMSDKRAEDDARSELISYLKYLTEEIALGSDAQLSNVLRRLRSNVRTSVNGEVEGIRISVSAADRERYDVEDIVLTPDAELGQIAEDLRSLLGELITDRQEPGRNE